MDIRTDCNVVSTGKRGNDGPTAVTAVLLHYSAMDTLTDCNDVSTG